MSQLVDTFVSKRFQYEKGECHYSDGRLNELFPSYYQATFCYITLIVLFSILCSVDLTYDTSYYSERFIAYTWCDVVSPYPLTILCTISTSIAIPLASLPIDKRESLIERERT